jgi:cell division protein FtsW (lipid II flippase)
MAVTFTSAADRDATRRVRVARRLDGQDLLLPLTSLAAILAISLAYGGQALAARATASTSGAGVANVNDAPNATDLEPRLAPAFPHDGDRRLAARELSRSLQRSRDEGRSLQHVGAILSVMVPAATIDRTPGLQVYAGRLRTAREQAARARQTPPDTIRLFTASDLAAVKPGLVVRSPEDFARQTLTYGAAFIIAFYLVAALWRLRGVEGDRLLLIAAHLLTAVGFAVLLGRPDPIRDTLLFARYTEGIVIGLAIMAAVSLLDFRKAAFLELSYLPLVGALCLSAILVLFGDGPGASDAKVNLGPIQPVEAIRLLLALFLAGYFTRRWELLRQARGAALAHVLPVVGGVALALVFFFLQKDLGPALFLSCVFLAMYAVARGRIVVPLAGLALLAGGFYLGYRLHISETLAARVAMWRSPWDNGVFGGDQVAQSIWALATGGLTGTGLGISDTRYLPAGHTDLVFSAIGEDLGIVGLAAVAAVYVLLGWRGFRVAMGAAGDYGFFLATAVTLFLVIPALVMGAGTLGLTPLTGVVTPFLSYGGSAMAANFAALGILTAIRQRRGQGEHRGKGIETTAPFRTPMRYLRGTLAAATAALMVTLVDVQIVRANQFVVKPQLGIQADGGRRYQYNPRVLDVVSLIPRGSVYDRRGVLLATGDPAIARQSTHPSCAEPIERCYPLGGAAFHLLGDLPTRINWGASNTSYVERDAESRLRGFDDQARVVQTSDRSGRRSSTLRRDYGEIVPLLRHRRDPDHPAVKALLSRDRDLHLTVDAGLQRRLAAILSAHARKSATGQAAAVVVDPDTGDVLALVSYPWPAMERQSAHAPDADKAALLDRARYGLYPPGSTFKLVTAAAALRRDLDLSGTMFGCIRLPDGRVGAKLPGRRPIRDDVSDSHPHGTIDMHDGLVRSCNAYFAQLALRVGPDAILETALKLGISVSPSGSLQRLRETLPQAGYGQGDVIASPLRMARVAAAIANGGVLREPRVIAGGRDVEGPTHPDLLLPPEAAERLARYMRDVVLEGTGRSLRGHPGRIAGKTGTAEVAGAASHAWFVGFAPHGPATRRIAFAVIIENAGYGGEAAAPVAGDIVSAALASGLIE